MKTRANFCEFVIFALHVSKVGPSPAVCRSWILPAGNGSNLSQGARKRRTLTGQPRRLPPEMGIGMVNEPFPALPPVLAMAGIARGQWVWVVEITRSLATTGIRSV